MGGVEVTTLITAIGINHDTFAPCVVCPTDGPLVEHLQQAAVPVKIIARPQFYSVTARIGGRLVPNPLALVRTALSTLQASTRLTTFIRDNADVVVTKGLLAHFYGGMAAMRARVPCIWHVQEVVNSTHLGGFYVKVFNAVARLWARLIVVDAQSVGAQFASDLHQTGKVRLLYNGIDIEQFALDGQKATLSFPAHNGHRPLVIGHVGRVVPLKGQHVLIEAFAQLYKQWPNVHLALVGAPLFDTDHYLRRLHEMVAAHDIEDRVHFLGFRRDIPDIMRALDIFVHPSVEADSPVSVQEAMATGLAVIASSVPGTVELISDGVDGYLVAPDDATALAAKLATLIGNPAARQQLAQAARQRAEQRYAKRVFLEEFEKLLHEAHTR
jgi:glycosyltransferase involved in cell wall biosynthesis